MQRVPRTCGVAPLHGRRLDALRRGSPPLTHTHALAPAPPTIPHALLPSGRGVRLQAQFPNWKKRRLYDVMSICQCLRVVERACKSQFVWRGTTRVQAAVYEFLLRDMAIRPLIDGVTELDPDEPAVPVTGLAFLCQQFVLLLRQRALDGEPASIGLEEATERLCQRVRSNDDKTVTFTRARLRRRPCPRAP